MCRHDEGREAAGRGVSSSCVPSGVAEPETPALPVARVAVDVPLPHLDRPFDYAVTPEHDLLAVPGRPGPGALRRPAAGRVRARTAWPRASTTGRSRRCTRSISAEPVLTAEVATLVRAVADHYAGTFADVVRLAVPPRHAATEKARPVGDPPPAPDTDRRDRTAGRIPERPGLPGCRARRRRRPEPRGRSCPRRPWRRLGRRPGRGGPGLRRGRPRSGAGGARPARPRPARRGLRDLARDGPVRRAGRGRRSGRPLSGVPGRPARRRPGRDREPRGGVRPGRRPRSGRAVGRRRRPAGRAARALPAHPRGAGPARRADRLRRALRAATPGRPSCSPRSSGAGCASWRRHGPGRRRHGAARPGERGRRLRPGPRPGGPAGAAAARGVRADARRAAAGSGAGPGAARGLSGRPGLPGLPRAGPLPLLRRPATRATRAEPGALELRLVRAAAGRLGVPDLRRPPGRARRWSGADRTAEELGRAFPRTPVRQSAAGHVLDEVPATARDRRRDTRARSRPPRAVTPPRSCSTPRCCCCGPTCGPPRRPCGAGSTRSRWSAAGADGGSVLAVGDSVRPGAAGTGPGRPGGVRRPRARRPDRRPLPAGGHAGQRRGPTGCWRSSSGCSSCPTRPRCSGRCELPSGVRRRAAPPVAAACAARSARRAGPGGQGGPRRPQRPQERRCAALPGRPGRARLIRGRRGSVHSCRCESSSPAPPRSPSPASRRCWPPGTRWSPS